MARALAPRDSTDRVIVTLAVLLRSAIPLARFLASNRCNARHRAKLRKAVGTREFEELANIINSLRR